jgi:hypothetical protein
MKERRKKKEKKGGSRGVSEGRRLVVKEWSSLAVL